MFQKHVMIKIIPFYLMALLHKLQVLTVSNVLHLKE